MKDTRDRNLDSLKLEETSNKNFGDILIEFQEEYEGNAGAKRVVFSGAVSHLICLIFTHCYHVVEFHRWNYSAARGRLSRITS
jgi:hypothetical protein